jgi:hypothetical protein
MLQAVSLAVVLQLANLAGAPAPLVAAAQAEVARVYSEIGVSVRWDQTGSVTDTRTIHVVLLPFETGDLRHYADAVMGAAVRTSEGTGIAYIYYGRVQQMAAQHDVASTIVLAGAMSHEIGHLLLGARAHSPDGLMRACWRRVEFHQAAERQLRFSPDEIAAIRTRLDVLLGDE